RRCLRGDFADGEASKGVTTMTNPNDGKQDTKTHSSLERLHEYFMNAFMIGKRASGWLTFSLTILLFAKRQYLYSLCGAALTLCAATSDRLRSLKIGLHGFASEWFTGEPRKRSPRPKGSG